MRAVRFWLWLLLRTLAEAVRPGDAIQMRGDRGPEAVFPAHGREHVGL